MKKSGCLGLVLLTVLSGCAPETDPVLKDKRLLAGTWLVVGSERKGVGDHALQLDGLDLIFEDDVITRKEPGEIEAKILYKIDPTQHPKAIDLTWVHEGKPVRTHHGIYQIEGKTLRICIQEDAKGPRPTEFASPKGSTFSLMELRHK